MSRAAQRAVRVARRPDRVRQIMRRDFVTVSVHDSLDEAISIMRLARLRHLAVERDGVLVGLLSYRDLQDRALARLGRLMDELQRKH